MTSAVWRRLAVDGVLEIPIASAHALDIFGKHLAVSLGETPARVWNAHPKIIDCLSPAGPRDAVRLTALVEEAMSKAQHFSEQLVSEVLDAYTNWEGELEHIFSADGDDNEDKEGRTRALRLAAAVLEGSGPSSIFLAARTLSDILDLRPESGHGLVGPSTRKRLESISARYDDGRVVFSRTAFAASTLDFVWSHWPQLHEDLQLWFRQLAQKLPDDGPLIADRVADLAIRQRHFALLNALATGYLNETGTFALGVTLLTRAAMSDELGRPARRTLYHWARNTPQRHSAVVATCTGALAEAFPRVALTRLKHVALNPATDIRQSLVEGLTSLAANPQLRRELLEELVRWLERSEPEPRRIVAAEALLNILLHRDPDGRLLLLEHTDPGWELALAAAWRSLLRSPASEEEMRSGISQWLEAAAQAKVPLSTVVAVLGAVLIVRSMKASWSSPSSVGHAKPRTKQWPHVKRSSSGSSTASSRGAEPQPGSPSTSRSRWSRKRGPMIRDFLHRLLGARASYSNEYTYRTRLPSELEGASFDATIEVHGRLDHEQPAQEAQVYRRLENRASAVSANLSVLDLDRAAAEITIELNRESIVSMPDLHARLDRVRTRLSAGASAIETARSLQEAVQKTTLAQMQHREKARQLGLLRDHFLVSPSMARMWWVGEDPNRLADLAGMSTSGKPDPFETAVRLLGGASDASSTRNEVATIIEVFLRELAPEARKFLISQLAQVCSNYEQPELARRLLSTAPLNGAS